MKLAARRIDALPRSGRDFSSALVVFDKSVVVRFPDVAPNDLQRAWLDVLKRARLTRITSISREELSVREHMSLILRAAADRQASRSSRTCSMRRAACRSWWCTSSRCSNWREETLVEITQAEPYAPIYVRLTYTPS